MAERRKRQLSNQAQKTRGLAKPEIRHTDFVTGKITREKPHRNAPLETRISVAAATSTAIRT